MDLRHREQPALTAPPRRGAGLPGLGPDRGRPHVTGADETDRVIDRVDSQSRQPALAAAHAELTYAEVALALDLPVGTVRSRLNRARRIVRVALDDTRGTHDDH